MKNSRKLAWVLLGGVATALAVLLSQIVGWWDSWSYGEWQAEQRSQIVTVSSAQGTYFAFGNSNEYWKFRKQRFPWLPGADEIRDRISRAQWLKLGGEPPQIEVLEEPVLDFERSPDLLEPGGGRLNNILIDDTPR